MRLIEDYSLRFRDVLPERTGGPITTYVHVIRDSSGAGNVTDNLPNETHELSRSGQPWHRVERLRSILGWMDKYIRGKDVPQFKDVQ